MSALQAAFGAGLPALAAILGTDVAGAARAAWQAGLIPRRWRLTRAGLLALVEQRDLSNTELGDLLGASRWAVAGWRARLGVERVRNTGRAPVGRSGPVGPPSRHDSLPHVEPETEARIGLQDLLLTVHTSLPPPLSVVGTPTSQMTLVGQGMRYLPGPAAERLLALLAQHHPQRVPLDQVTRTVYPGQEEQRARRAIHSTVWRLRRALPPGLVINEVGLYRLGLADDQVRHSCLSTLDGFAAAKDDGIREGNGLARSPSGRREVAKSL